MAIEAAMKIAENKINIQGGSYVVVIPKSWGEHHALRKGDKVRFLLTPDWHLFIEPTSDRETAGKESE